MGSKSRTAAQKGIAIGIRYAVKQLLRDRSKEFRKNAYALLARDCAALSKKKRAILGSKSR